MDDGDRLGPGVIVAVGVAALFVAWGLAAVIQAARVDVHNIHENGLVHVLEACLGIALVIAAVALLLYFTVGILVKALDRLFHSNAVPTLLAAGSAVLFHAAEPAMKALGLPESEQWALAGIPVLAAVVGTACSTLARGERRIPVVVGVLTCLVPLVILGAALATVDWRGALRREGFGEQRWLLGAVSLYVGAFAWIVWLIIRKRRPSYEPTATR